MNTKKNFFVAIIVMVVVAFASIAVVSCKKDDPKAMLGQNVQPVKTFSVPEVEDMNAYLKGFKQKMQTATRGEDEMLGLEEAAWHLSSVANYDFANANVEFTDLRYDTLRYHINVANGEVSLNDLNPLYSNVSSDIDEFYHSLNLEEKHFRFIGADISNSGQVEVSVITSFRVLDHTWYFGDSWEAGVMCDSLFTEDSYVWNTTAKTTLEYAMNLLEGRDYIVNEQPPQRIYYVYTMRHTFKYEDYIDPYGSPFFRNSRICALEADTWAVPTLNWNAMCYCLDSYLGLSFEHINAHPNLGNQRPVHWGISCHKKKLNNSHWHLFYHSVNVTFAQVVVSNEDPINY